MAVLKGEGRVPILFGSLPLPMPPNRSAYLARPDLGGEFSTVVIAPDTAGITPSVKALARHLARHGYGVLVPVLREGFEAAVHDLADAVESARIPGTPWASPERIALVGLGTGGGSAAVVASEARVLALALIGASLDRDLLEAYDGALLVLHGAADSITPADEVRELQREMGRGEWVLYKGVPGGFFEDASDSHDPGAAHDVLERLVGFLDVRLGAVPTS